MYARVARPAGLSARPPMVLVHGFVVSGAYMLPLARALAPCFDVYVPDLPGFGNSEGPYLDVPGLADALAAWMSANGLEHAAVLGNSFGSQVATMLALRHPDLVARLILTSPTVEPRRRRLLTVAGRLGLAALYEPNELRLIFLRDFMHAGLPRAIYTAHLAISDPIEERLAHIAAPTLVLRGSRDALVSEGWTRYVAQQLPLGRMVTMPGAAHAVNYDSPRWVARLVRAFLLGDTAAGSRQQAAGGSGFPQSG